MRHSHHYKELLHVEKLVIALMSITQFFVSRLLVTYYFLVPTIVVSDWCVIVLRLAAIGSNLYHVINVAEAAPTAPKFKNVSEST